MKASAIKVAYENAEPVSSWPAPDLTVLNEGRREPPALPPAMFGRAWPEFQTLAIDKGAPVDYVAMSYLAIAASVIGGKRRLRPYVEGTWREPPIIWLGLVGDPSANKSPAIDPFLNVLRDLERDYAEEHKGHLGAWLTECERAKVERSAWQDSVKAAAKEGLSTPPMPIEARDPAEPRRRRTFLQDGTPEAVAEVLAGNPQGTLLMRDELAGWLESFDRYAPGGRAFWLEAYGGRSFTVDRKSSPEPLSIAFNGVSVIGGIQTQKLAEALMGGRCADDGLSARFLWVWPKRPVFSRPHGTADLASFEAALRRLDSLEWARDQNGDCCPLVLRLEDGAADVFEGFQRANIEREDNAGGLLKSFIGKLNGIALRLALTVELAKWAWDGGTEPTSVSQETLVSVADYIETYALPMAERVYGDAALPPIERHTACLARYIRRLGQGKFNARDLRRTASLPGLREAGPFNECIEALVEAGWLRAIPTRAGEQPGRRSSDYLVNPAIQGGA